MEEREEIKKKKIIKRVNRRVRRANEKKNEE